VVGVAGFPGGGCLGGMAWPAPPDLPAKTARIAVLTALGRLPARERDAALRNCIEACFRLVDDEGGGART